MQHLAGDLAQSRENEKGAQPAPIDLPSTPPKGIHGPGALDRVLRALNHPVRRRILRELQSGPASAKGLAEAFEEEVGLVSYHLNQVLAKEAGIVDLVDTVARRGALEKFYALTPRIWEELAKSPELAGGEHEILSLEVDDPALSEILDAKRECRSRIQAAVEASRDRGADLKSETMKIIVGLTAFPLREAGINLPPQF